MPSKSYNPENRAWKGRSYKKGAERIAQLRETLENKTTDPICPNCCGQGELLGALGRTTYFHCINCGANFS